MSDDERPVKERAPLVAIVQAQPGYWLHQAYRADCDVVVYTVPIIAWRVCQCPDGYEQVWPVTPDNEVTRDWGTGWDYGLTQKQVDKRNEGPLKNIMAIEYPNGAVHGPDEGAWASADEWVRELGCLLDDE